MSGLNAFETYSDEYDGWFDEHEGIFRSELECFRSLMPDLRGRTSVEIGIGTGRFALPLGIPSGLEPSSAMALIARHRGLRVMEGRAEKMPYPDEHFDLVLLSTTVCFMDDPKKAFREVYRILKPGGTLLNGFVPADSEFGRGYLERKDGSRFYKEARFYTVGEVIDLSIGAGFRDFFSRQTLFDSSNGTQASEPGYGRGSFVVVKAMK